MSGRWPEHLNLRYDRRVSDDFLSLFVPGGDLSVLAEYARKAPYPIDLQFRRDIKTDAQRATLYVGTEKVLDVHRYGASAVRFGGHRTRSTPSGFDEIGSASIALCNLRLVLDPLGLYLDRVIPPVAGGSAGVEGAVQSAVSSYNSAERSMLDREFILQFRDDPTRRRVLGEAGADLLALAKTAPVPGAPPERLGGEADLIAVDGAGDLLAIEVKPRNASTITWAPLQVIVYARLLSRWLATDGAAVEILRGVADQRRAIGLLTPEAAIGDDPAVRPLLAIQRGIPERFRDRLAAVLQHLVENDVAEAADLEVFEVDLAGRLTPLMAS